MFRCAVGNSFRQRLCKPTWMNASEVPGLRSHQAEEVKLVPMSSSDSEVMVHVPWTPDEFVGQAIKLGHPRPGAAPGIAASHI